MENPFLKRATEYLRDDAAFLAVVSPEPIKYFLGPFGKSGALYDRLAIVSGTPGSGKTTFARLFEYSTVTALLRNRTIDNYKGLFSALVDCRAITNLTPNFVGLRLPLETDYRDFWEFPYPDELKAGLLTSMLQARAILGWMRQIVSVGIPLDNVSIMPRKDTDAAIEAIGGVHAPSLVTRARYVESSIYKIVGALLPPRIADLDPGTTSAYRPFDAVEKIRIATATKVVELRPLVMFDDAHTLHPDQFEYVRRWLTRRELLVSRWILTRLDVLNPAKALAALADRDTATTPLPGITADRDFITILLQGGSASRREDRGAFRKLARDMGDRYLRRMSVMNQRGLHSLKDLLGDEIPSLSDSNMRKLREAIAKEVKGLSIPDTEHDDILKKVQTYLASKGISSPATLLAMIRVLIHRYSVRNPQRDLFETETVLEPSRPVQADVSVYDAAQLRLHHEFNMPYYYGVDDLCDASSENAEQFLHLAAVLVDAAVTRIIRGKPPTLSPEQQCSLLREKAKQVVQKWDFPYHSHVRTLAGKMAIRCLGKSLESNAPLGAGANAFGIPQEEFDDVAGNNPEFSHVLKFAVAYNALSIVPGYSCKNREWCLLELGGTVILAHGLTLKRGGFIESSLQELEQMLKADRDE